MNSHDRSRSFTESGGPPDDAEERTGDRTRSAANRDETCTERGSLGRWQLREEIGRGGMGVVYRGVDRVSGQTVAVKLLQPGGASDPVAIRRFEREVRVLQQLRHPGIVGIISGGTTEGRPYLVMEHVDGCDLGQWLRHRPRSHETIATLFATLCDTVEHAHRHGVIHRDLKPGNVLVDRRGELHVLDFGISRRALGDLQESEDDATLTAAGEVVGTVAYLPPEALEGTSSATIAHDVYAIGVMLYQALAGRRPFGGRSTDEIARRIRLTRPPRLSTLPHPVPRSLERIVEGAMASDPRARYPSARAIAADLRRFLDGRPSRGPAGRLRRALAGGRRLSRVSGRLVAGVIVVLLVLAAVAAAAAIVRVRSFEKARDRAAEVQWVLDLGRRPTVVLAPAQLLLAEAPEVTEAVLLIGAAMARDEQMRPAAPAFLHDHLEEVREPWAVRLLLAELYRRGGDSAQASELAGEAVLAFPSTADAWYVQSFATLDPERALDSLRRALEKDPDHRRARERRVRLLTATGRFEAALEEVRRIDPRGRRHRGWREFEGVLLLRLQRLHEADTVFRGLTADGARPTAHRHRATVSRLLGRYVDAVDAYTAAMELDGEGRPNAWDRYQRATPLWILGRLEEAAEDLRRVRVVLGRPFFADARRALVLRGMDRHEDARRCLEDAIRSCDDPWLDLVLRCTAGQLAPEELVNAAGDDPERRCEACYYAGESLLGAGRVDDAVEMFRCAVDTGSRLYLSWFPPQPMNEYELAEWRLGTLAEARLEGSTPAVTVAASPRLTPVAGDVNPRRTPPAPGSWTIGGG